jgi:hypothetical protein
MVARFEGKQLGITVAIAGLATALIIYVIADRGK